MSEIENGRLRLHDTEHSKCNHLTTLDFKGLSISGICAKFLVHVYINMHPIRCEAHANFFRRAILTRQVSQTDLAFGVQSRFVSRCVYARLQVSVCSGYDLFQCG